MARNVVYVVSDESEFIEKAKAYFGGQGVTCQVYSSAQWEETQKHQASGMPSLMSGSNPLERSNVLQFPSQSASPSGEASRVATIDELESKAIENAIMQYRGNLTEAAKALGIGRATLYRKVKQYQIDPSMARKKRAA